MIITFVVIISAFVFPGRAATTDSVKVKIKTTYTTLRLLDIRQDTFQSVDSSLEYFQHYNKATRPDYFSRELGYIGSVATSLTLTVPPVIGFDLGLHQFDAYLINKDQIAFYNTHTPYSEFSYAQGTKVVQKFNVLHSRNITPWWNIAIFYNFLTSDGFHLNSKTNHRIFGATTWVHTKKYRYAAYLSMIKNTFKTGENGGVTNDSLFGTYTATEKLNALFCLTNAKQELTYRNYSLTQILNLSKPDTNLIKGKLFPYKNQFYFRYNINYSEQQYKYFTDLFTDTSYYKQIFDSNSNEEILKSTKLENDISFNANSGVIREDGFKDFNFRPGIRFQYMTLKKDSVTDRNFRNLMFNFVIDKYFFFSRLFAEGNYIYAGQDAGNMFLQGYLKFFLPFEFMLRPGISQTIKSPSYMQDFAHTNYFRWDNNFKPIKITNLFAGLTNSKFKFVLNANYFLMNEYIYFNDDITPKQLTDPLSYFSVELKKDIKLGKFHFDNHLMYQKELSNFNVIHLPTWILYNSTYYENNLFKNALHLKIGFDVRVQDEYYADAYYAPYSIFYNQSDVSIKTYPVFDLFLSATIKTMRIFIKYEHINQDLFPDYPSYNYPHFPTEPRVLRYGFCWMFFN
jgi:hypothetical protein